MSFQLADLLSLFISNAGPVENIEKVVLGSFHQRDSRSGATAVIQCACNSLLALCSAKICGCRIWQKDDLDHVLNERGSTL